MTLLLSLAKAIDALNRWVGRIVIWLTLIVVLISAGNAVVRKVLNVSSNAWLEMQWYLFGALFLLAAGYTFLCNEHVRVDVLSQRFSRQLQVKIEIFGVLFFMLPACVLILWLSVPMFVDAWVLNEQSSNAGGLVRWPVKLLIPLGFGLLVLAGISHLIKCLGYLLGRCDDPMLVKSEAVSEVENADGATTREVA